MTTIREKSAGVFLFFVWIWVCGSVNTVLADALRTQTLAVKSGWNAVYLEVEPMVTDPAKVMAGTPVDIVASFYDPGVSPQYVSNPSASLFKDAGWGVWYAESRPDAFLKSLYAIYGQRAYLIHSTNDFTWRVTGTVFPAKVKWTPDAFNFTGFALSSSAPPSFGQFFSGSAAHQHNKIYRLANGAWRQVTNPATEAMRAGEAFWIYCSGGSTFQGPLSVETTTSHGMLLGLGGGSLVLRNVVSHPISPVIEHVPSGSNSVPFMVVVQAVGGAETPIKPMGVPQPDGAWSLQLPPLESGASLKLPFEARMDALTLPVHQSLLKVTCDVGTEIWIPVVAVRNDKGE